MPLSERERKVLEELELDLAASDPRLAHQLSSGSLRTTYKARPCIGAVAFLIGVFLLMVGVASHIILVGASGFLLMGTGTHLLLASHPGHQSVRPQPQEGVEP